jgi:CheY-like chemotaxis protein
MFSATTQHAPEASKERFPLPCEVNMLSDRSSDSTSVKMSTMGMGDGSLGVPQAERRYGAKRVPSRARALVVEDEPAVLKLVATVLRAAGFEVTAVDTGPGACAAMQEGAFDVILTDLHLTSTGTGLEVAMAAAQCFPPPPVVVITGSVSMATGELTNWSEVNEIVLKPFSASQLVEACRRAIEA